MCARLSGVCKTFHFHLARWYARTLVAGVCVRRTRYRTNDASAQTGRVHTDQPTRPSTLTTKSPFGPVQSRSSSPLAFMCVGRFDATANSSGVDTIQRALRSVFRANAPARGDKGPAGERTFFLPGEERAARGSGDLSTDRGFDPFSCTSEVCPSLLVWIPMYVQMVAAVWRQHPDPFLDLFTVSP